MGTSLTEGYLATSYITAYPFQLGGLLDMEKYDVRNFGSGGTTVMKSPETPYGSYWDSNNFKKSHDYNPDIVIMLMGGNDTYEPSFGQGEGLETELEELVRSYQELESKPIVYLSTQPCKASAEAEEIRSNIVNPIIERVAERTGATLVDLHAVTKGITDNPEFLAYDGTHLNDAGYFKLACIFYEMVFSKELTTLSVLADPGVVVSLAGQSVTIGDDGKGEFTVGDGVKQLDVMISRVHTKLRITVQGETEADLRGIDSTSDFEPKVTYASGAVNVGTNPAPSGNPETSESPEGTGPSEEMTEPQPSESDSNNARYVVLLCVVGAILAAAVLLILFFRKTKKNRKSS